MSQRTLLRGQSILLRHSKRQEYNAMQAIGDPDLYEISEVVEKSSKSGIFSNTRLLMIKDGFLYYFSTVPQGYKSHEQNLMSTLKEFPKSSIEIRQIRKIRLESPKSSTLIIEFNQKDMIDRQDIRKSLSSKNFNHPVKDGHAELEEWKFTFSTFSKCKHWYYVLQTLKAHFQKHQAPFDPFTGYMANFDNELRKSLPRLSPSSQNSLLSPSSNSQLSVNASGPANNTSRNSSPQLAPPKPKNFPSAFGEPQFQKQTIPAIAGQGSRIQKYNIDKPGIFSIEEEEEHEEELTNPPKQAESQKQEEIKSQSIIERLDTISIELHDSPNKSKVQQGDNLKGSQTQAHNALEGKDSQFRIKALQKEKERIKQQAEQALAQAVQEARESILKQQRTRAEEQARLLQKSLEEKDEMIKKMQEELEMRKRAQLELEDQALLEMHRREEDERLRRIQDQQMREEEQYRRLRQFIGSEPSIEREVKEAHLKEESIQTEFQRDLIQGLDQNHGFNTQQSSLSRYSDKSNQNRQQPTLEPTLSELQQQRPELEIQRFDYFYELGQLYKQQDSACKTQKELILAQFVREATKRATSIVQTYLDENKPPKPIKIDRNIFGIEIVCQKGQLIRTNEEQRLVYTNELHQQLKRKFKIYNQLNDIIICNLKKKPNYPLRVPFSCLIEYKGYTALAQIQPARLNPSRNSSVLKTLGPGIPTYNLRLFDFEAGDLQCSLLSVATPYKSTKTEETCLLRQPLKTWDFIDLNRRHNISICTKKLLQQAGSVENGHEERSRNAKAIIWARQLKNFMKASTPFVEAHRQLEFFADFLENPHKMIDSTAGAPLTGIFLYYCQRLLGVNLSDRIDSAQLSYFLAPVVRSFAFSTLDISLFASKTEKFSLEGKFELAEQALKYSKELQDDYTLILMKEIFLDICRGDYSQALRKINLGYQMTTPHDPYRLKLLQLKAQCCEALGSHEEVLSILKDLLEQTQYMYRDKSKLVQVYFLIAGTLSRQQLNRELVEVYRKILRESPKHRHRVILEFSQTMLAQQADPHILLDFIQQQHQEQSDAPQTQILLGDIYFRCKNYQKAISFYETAFETIINIKTNHPSLFDVYQRLIQSLPSLTQKKSIHRQIVAFAAHNSLSREFVRKINTLVAECVSRGLSREARTQLVKFIKKKGKDSERWIGSLEGRVLQWVELQKHVGGVVRSGDEVSLKTLVEAVDCSRLSERCMELNQSEDH